MHDSLSHPKAYFFPGEVHVLEETKNYMCSSSVPGGPDFKSLHQVPAQNIVLADIHTATGKQCPQSLRVVEIVRKTDPQYKIQSHISALHHINHCKLVGRGGSTLLK